MSCFTKLGPIGSSSSWWVAMSYGDRVLVFPRPVTGYVERWDLMSLSVVDSTFAPFTAATSAVLATAVKPDETIYMLNSVTGARRLHVTSPGGSDTTIVDYPTGDPFPQHLGWDDPDAVLYAYYRNVIADSGLYSVDTSTGTMTRVVDDSARLSSSANAHGIVVTSDGAVWYWLNDGTDDILNRYTSTDGLDTLVITSAGPTLGVHKTDPTKVWVADQSTGHVHLYEFSGGAISDVNTNLCGGSFLSDPEYPYGSVGNGASMWSTDYAEIVLWDANQAIWIMDLTATGDWHVGGVYW